MGNLNNRFDLTTEKNRKNALALAAILLPSPLLAGYWLGKSLWSNVSSLVSNAKKDFEEQRQLAIDIIRAGKDNNVDEIEITISQQAGLGFSANIDGIPIEVTIQGVTEECGFQALKILDWYGLSCFGLRSKG